VNERIRINQIRVIAEDGAQLGVMTPMDALKLARERGFDLVEVAPMANPPVCRIMDFNKFKYEQDKQDREARRKRHVARLKEIKFRPHIGDHDYGVKLNQLKRFLERGDNVKITMMFRGREMAHTETGRRVLQRLCTDAAGFGLTERSPMLEGRFMTMVLLPDHTSLKRTKQRPPHAVRQAPPAAPTSAATTTTGPRDGQTQNA
jgi:translation initiation factor IF-3